MTETHTRTLTRLITYRLLAIAITAFWTGLSGAVVIHIILTMVHYVSERIWLKIDWGKIHV